MGQQAGVIEKRSLPRMRRGGVWVLCGSPFLDRRQAETSPWMGSLMVQLLWWVLITVSKSQWSVWS